MKPASLTYRRARDVAEAVGLVAAAEGGARFLAGGQTLGPLINLRLVQPELLVDIGRLEELRRSAMAEGRLAIGAATRHAEIEDGAVADPAQGMLRQVAAGIAYRAIRNRGTLGGSLAHADPAAEWPVVMTALDAAVRIRGPAGRRELPVRALIEAALTTSLAEGELIEAVAVTPLSGEARWGFVKRCRKVGEFAFSLAAAVADPARGFGRVVIGATARGPVELPGTGRLLAQTRHWQDGCEAAIRTAYEADLDAAGIALDDYDRHVHGVSVIRAIRQAFA